MAKQEARVLKGKAIASLVNAMEAFNSPRDEGRSTNILLHLQHSFEMLLKAMLVQLGESVFDKKLGRSIGFESCVKKASQHPSIKLSSSDAGTLRAIDAMRDDEQHWYTQVSEQILYLHARAGVTLFDDLLYLVFQERLASYLPHRVLPVTAEAPRDVALILNEEYAEIARLLQPGRRAGHEARARIRTLLAMEAHVEAETRVSQKDVGRVEKGIKKGQSRETVFPKLHDLSTSTDGEGLTLKLHFTKNVDAPPVRYEVDETVPAAAIREVDLHHKYHLSKTDLAEKLGISTVRSAALRLHLGIDDDLACLHEFEFGSQHLPRYSNKALMIMKEAVRTLDMNAVWEAHRSRPNGQIRECSVSGCRARPN
ncbi:DUF3644 domain-containing protein [Actinomadura sp. WMMB 499]|uniref:DUF3644 domain-containing protein n=1 Tax=Actinomadura sp. WMMB 499 TaxID=1219491 RepID=UPI00159DE8DA|nr:DUF3644 domain-containing protein [Actinomadura sp. WMMB 499]